MGERNGTVPTEQALSFSRRRNKSFSVFRKGLEVWGYDYHESESQEHHPLPKLVKLTEVWGLSFVGSTGEVRHPHHLWNLQNLGPVPPYTSQAY